MNLYNNIRPKTFNDMIMNCNSLSTIINDAKNNTLKHAYLLAGVYGTGKTTVANLIAKAYDCISKDEVPCGKCEYCTSNNTSNIIEINAGSFRGINDIKQLIDRYSIRGLGEGTTVLLFNEAHKLTRDAKDALLVSTEQPPKHLKFIFTTTELSSIKEDLRSRFQVHIFKPLTYDQSIHLTNKALTLLNKVSEKTRQFTEEEYKLIFDKSEGIPRNIISLTETYYSSDMSFVEFKSYNYSKEISEEDNAYTHVIELIKARDMKTAANHAYHIMKNDELSAFAIRLSLMKKSIEFMAKYNINNYNEKILLNELLRPQLDEVNPMVDLLTRLLEYVYKKININN